MTIRRLLLLGFIALFIYTLSAFLSLRALRHQRDEALVFNLAGRQRMLIQQMRLQVLGIQIGQNPAYRETLDDTAHTYFEQTLNALIAGGPALYVDGRTVTLPPAQHPEILAQLEIVRATWESMHAAIHRVLEVDPQSEDFKEATAEVERLSPELLGQMDAAVRMYEEDTRRDLTNAYTNQLSFTAMLAAIVLFALIVAERLILKPIARLGVAARRIGEGNLTTPVPVSGVSELSQLARHLDDMRRGLAASAETQAALLKLSRCLLAAIEERAVAECAVEVSAATLAADFCALVLPDAEGRLLVRAAHGWPEEIIGHFEVAGGDASQTGYTLQHGHPVAVEDYAREMAFAVPPVVFEQGIVSGLSVPMFLEQRVVGAMLVHSRTRRRFGDGDMQLLSLIANQTAVAMEKARLFGEVQQLAATDSLTGLHNRRHFFELAEREFERARRYGRPLAAIMLDIDHFKHVNDSYGHAIGDQVLRVIASRCQESLREIDVLGRYGGEEFVALLPENDLEGACKAAERLRLRVADTPMDTLRGPLTVTISLGVAAFTESCPGPSELLNQADAAMYAAKAAGRNRVVVSGL